MTKSKKKIKYYQVYYNYFFDRFAVEEVDVKPAVYSAAEPYFTSKKAADREAKRLNNDLSQK